MIHFSAVQDRHRLGRLLRLPLRLLPKQLVLPVLQGPLRGARWVVGTSNHGCWLGSYEAEKQLEMASAIGPDDVFYDVGANVGFYTLMASRIVGPHGRVHAFEPLPQNLAALRHHLELNGAGNVTVHDAAVAEAEAEVRFAVTESNAMGHLSPDGSLVVRTVTLDGLHGAGVLEAPTCIKIDVEGAEGQVLRGALSLLRATRPTIFLATHGRDAHDECVTLLRALGYTLRGVGGRLVDDTDELVARPAPGKG